MNEYGFGLKESMIFLVTITICIFTTMFMYNRTFKEIFEGPKHSSYSELESSLKSAGTRYVLNYHDSLENGDDGYVDLSTLKEKKLINAFSDEKGTECTGYVFFKHDDNKTSYIPYIKCGSYYKTNGYNSNYE